MGEPASYLELSVRAMSGGWHAFYQAAMGQPENVFLHEDKFGAVVIIVARTSLFDRGAPSSFRSNQLLA